MGAYLSTPVTEKDVFEGSNGTLAFGGSAMQGWRRTMEDAHVAALRLGNDSEVAMFGVFDGHGGSEVAKFCQKHMPEEILRMPEFRQGNCNDALVKLFHKMDEMLKDEKYSQEIEQYKGKRSDDEEDSEMEGEASGVSPNEAIDMLKKIMALRRVMHEGGGSSNNNEEGEADFFMEDDIQEDNLPEHSIQAGCTAVVAILKGKDLFIANAGDSRAVLCRGGKAVALSEDHKPAQDTEKNRIVQAGGFLSEIGGVCRVNGNLNLSRAIGDLKYKSNNSLPPKDQIITAQPDVRRIELTQDDQFLVLACDGVWDVKDNQEVCDFVSQRLQKKMSPKDICCELLDNCLAANPRDAKGIGCDNMTAEIVVFLKHVSL